MPAEIETATGLTLDQIDKILRHAANAVMGVLELMPPPLRAFALAIAINQSSDVAAFYDSIGRVLDLGPDDEKLEEAEANSGVIRH